MVGGGVKDVWGWIEESFRRLIDGVGLDLRGIECRRGWMQGGFCGTLVLY